MFTTSTAKISGLNFYEAFFVTAFGGIMGCLLYTSRGTGAPERWLI